MRLARLVALLLVLSATACAAACASVASSAVSARPAGSCGNYRYPPTRDPSNPLVLPNPSGANPLNGAQFFVDGPRHGPAAGEIAKLLGLNPARFPDSYSWAAFKRNIESGRLHRRLVGHPYLAWEIHEYEKIADQPEELRFSLFSGGGGPGAIYGQVHKVLCHNLTADPGTVPIITTYFLYQAGYCESRQQIIDNAPTFRRQIDELVDGLGRHPAVMLLELDGVATSNCVGPGGLGPWEADLRYEIKKVSSLPHTVVYVEGGYADDNGPGYTARVLNAIGIRRIRGFFTNDTHEDWTSWEIRWGDRVSQLTHGAHFIVNTAANGRGPLLNPHPGTQGIEDLCNPPGRGLGPPPTAHTGFKHVDAFVWTGVPGNSSGCGGGPPAGVWWPARALSLAVLAQAKLGPGWPNDPY